MQLLLKMLPVYKKVIETYIEIWPLRFANEKRLCVAKHESAKQFLEVLNKFCIDEKSDATNSVTNAAANAENNAETIMVQPLPRPIPLPIEAEGLQFLVVDGMNSVVAKERTASEDLNKAPPNSPATTARTPGVTHSGLYFALRTMVRASPGPKAKVSPSISSVSSTYSAFRKRNNSDDFASADQEIIMEAAILAGLTRSIAKEQQKITQIRIDHGAAGVPHPAGSYDGLLFVIQENIYAVQQYNHRHDEFCQLRGSSAAAQKAGPELRAQLENLLLFILKFECIIAFDRFINTTDLFKHWQKITYSLKSGFQARSNIESSLHQIAAHIISFEHDAEIRNQFIDSMMCCLDVKSELEKLVPLIEQEYIDEVASIVQAIDLEFKTKFPEESLVLLAEECLKIRSMRRKPFLLDDTNTNQDSPCAMPYQYPTPVLGGV
jgi:hypothetical protein